MLCVWKYNHHQGNHLRVHAERISQGSTKRHNRSNSCACEDDRQVISVTHSELVNFILGARIRVDYPWLERS